MKIFNFLALYIFSFSAIFTGCSGGDNENKKDDIANDSVVSNADTSKQSDLLIYTLPAPMQIPTAIHKLNGKFKEEYLKPSDIQKPGTADKNKEAVLLGMYGVDLGYCSV